MKGRTLFEDNPKIFLRFSSNDSEARHFFFFLYIYQSIKNYNFHIAATLDNGTIFENHKS